MVDMKMRFEARCAYCRDRLAVGAFAMRMYGGYWHTSCLQEYTRRRNRQSIAASGG